MCPVTECALSLIACAELLTVLLYFTELVSAKERVAQSFTDQAMGKFSMLVCLQFMKMLPSKEKYSMKINLMTGSDVLFFISFVCSWFPKFLIHSIKHYTYNCLEFFVML